MSDTWRPLPIWCADGELAPADLARVKVAKESLWLDYKVVPQVAFEGSIDDRVLAWGSAPEFVCAYALVDPLGPDRELEDALAWVLGEQEETRVAMRMEHVLSVLAGGREVREVPAAELEAEAKLAAYEAGL